MLQTLTLQPPAATTSHLPFPLDLRPCYDCNNSFAAQPGAIRCSSCRAGRGKRLQATPAFDMASFNPLQKSFQLSNTH
jgi:hypothetical protein